MRTYRKVNGKWKTSIDRGSIPRIRKVNLLIQKKNLVLSNFEYILTGIQVYLPA